MQIEPQLVGREEELSHLNMVLKNAIDGKGKVFFISGEGGIGKTRLASEFTKGAAEKGVKVLTGNCVPSSRIGYMPFIEAFSGLVEEPSTEKMGRGSRIRISAKKAAPEIMEAIPIVGNILKGAGVFYNEYQLTGEGSEVDDKQMLFATLKLLTEETAKRPMILELDDLQWADTATVGLLHYLARNIKEMRLLILGIYRPEDILLDRKVGGNPFLDSLRIMRRENLCEELTLKPMTEGEVSQIVSGILNKPVSTVTVNKIFRESGGKPLFAVEMVRQMETSGSLVCKENDWNILETNGSELPISVKEVVLRRIERLSKDERRSLEYAAVIGSHFDTEILSESMKMDHLTLLESLEHLHDDHQLVKEVDGAYAFEEEQVRRVTYDCISKLRRKEIHKVIAQLLEGRLPNESLYRDLARHYHFAGDVRNAVKYSIMAGRFCLDRQVVIEAFPFFELAVELTGKDPSMKDERPKALEGLADCYITKDSARSDALYEECLALVSSVEDSSRLNRKRAECWLPNMQGKGDGMNAARLLDLAQKSVEAQSCEDGEISVLRGQLAKMEGDIDRMTLEFERALEIFTKAGMMIKVADLTFAEIMVLVQMGEVMTAKERLASLRKVNTGIDSNRTDAEVLLCHGTLKYLQGEIDDGVADLTKAAGIATPLGNHKLLSLIMTSRACAYIEKGSFDKALNDLKDGLQCIRTVESTFDHAVLTFYSAICHLNLNETKEANDLFNEVSQVASSYKGGLGTTLSRLVETGRAIALHRAGELQSSSIAFRNGLDGAKKELSFFTHWEAVARLEHADVLLKLGHKDKAMGELTRARELFSSFGNEKRVAEITRMLAS